jgi:CHRD domain/PEP-CTERM motif
MIRLASFSLAITLIAIATPAKAGFIFTSVLSGSNEVPVRATPATGIGTADLNGDLLTVLLTFTGLTTPSGAAHIHCCAAAGTNGPVAIDFVSRSFPLGVTSGTYSQTVDLGLISTYTTGFVNANGGTLGSARAAFLAGLFGGRTYFNIHTTQFPGGEIRGQIPEPTSLALMGFGLMGLGIASRRKR